MLPIRCPGQFKKYPFVSGLCSGVVPYNSVESEVGEVVLLEPEGELTGERMHSVGSDDEANSVGSAGDERDVDSFAVIVESVNGFRHDE